MYPRTRLLGARGLRLPVPLPDARCSHSYPHTQLPMTISPAFSKYSTLGDFVRIQMGWSPGINGPGLNTRRLLNHIRKEIEEIEADPMDLVEWIDIIILAIDGAWRVAQAQGASDVPGALVAALHTKMAKNHARKWPDWRELPEDAPVEHVRAAGESPKAPLPSPAPAMPPYEAVVRKWFVGWAKPAMSVSMMADALKEDDLTHYEREYLLDLLRSIHEVYVQENPEP